MSTALIRRYGFEFTDDGNRDSLPILKPGLGVAATVAHRWSGDTITDPNGAQMSSWAPAVGRYPLQSLNTAYQPQAGTVSGVKCVRMGAVDVMSGNPSGLDLTGSKTVTMLVSLSAVPTSAGRRALNMGTGIFEYNTSGAPTVWFNPDGTSGRWGTGSAIPTGQWHVVSVVAVENGIHELTVDTTHAASSNSTSLFGMTSLSLGAADNGVQMDVADVIVWDQALTRAQRETLAETLPAYYGL